MSAEMDAFSSMSDEVLESEIRGLAARVAAAMCRFLLAVAEYDRRRGWERWECHDMAGWLAWKCGISPVTAREHCRVAQGLLQFPLVRERFGAGQLSYTQVRAICRAATPGTEAMLVELAEVSTGAQLERIARAWRRSAPALVEEERARYAGRFLRVGYDDEGCLVGSFRVPAESGALMVGALQALTEATAVEGAEAEGARDPFAAVQVDALVELVAAGHAALAAGSTDEEDSRFLVTVVTQREVLEGEEPSEGPALECHIDDGPGLSGETARRIACDCTVVGITEGPDGSILDVGRRTRLISRRMRRALHRRDTHCRYPGCSHRVIEGHHIWHWIKGGPTRLDNLVSLCARHHHRLHEGGFRIRRWPSGRIEFVHPDGWTIPEVCPGPTQQESGLQWRDPSPYQDAWDGTPLDLGWVVEGLVLADRAYRAADSAESVGAPHPEPALKSR